MIDCRQFIIDLYIKATKECPLHQLGPPYTYYYSDETKSNILAKNIIEIDIKSAFPTICKILFGKEHPFVKNIFNINDKLQRNIFISTTLTDQTKIDNIHYLNELNLWSKMLILSYTYLKYKNIHILEYVKDGIMIKGELNNEPPELFYILSKFIKEHEILFHEKIKPFYIRFNKTTISIIDDKLKIKGNYHEPPEYLRTIIQDILNGNIYNKKLIELKRIYSKLFFNILYKTALKDDIRYYYQFQENKYLDKNNKLTQTISEIYPKGYLFEFIYPILSLIRIDYKNKSFTF